MRTQWTRIVTVGWIALGLTGPAPAGPGDLKQVQIESSITAITSDPLDRLGIDFELRPTFMTTQRDTKGIIRDQTGGSFQGDMLRTDGTTDPFDAGIDAVLHLRASDLLGIDILPKRAKVVTSFTGFWSSQDTPFRNPSVGVVFPHFIFNNPAVTSLGYGAADDATLRSTTDFLSVQQGASFPFRLRAPWLVEDDCGDCWGAEFRD